MQVLANPSNSTAAKPLANVGQAILWGGLISGVLDAIDGVTASAFKGLNPIQVLQYIASGLVGPSAFKGGLATAGLGTLAHFVIAYAVTAIYVIAATRISALRTQAVPFGLAFGAAVYLVMTYAVLPLTPIGNVPFELPFFLNGVIGHAVFVGLTISLTTRKWLGEPAA